MTDLDHLKRPCLDVPLTLRYTPDIVVDEQTFGLDLENQAVGDFAYAGDKLRHRLGEEIVEEVDGLDDNLVRVSRRVRAALRSGRCGARRRLRWSV